MTAAQRWDEKYRTKIAPAGPWEVLRRAMAIARLGDALDLACGLGGSAIALAEAGWNVTAVDVSKVALARLGDTVLERRLSVSVVLADLEAGEYVPRPQTFDLIVVSFYLQRDLFPAIREALRPGGLFAGEIHMVDDDPAVPPMNPAYLLQPGELRAHFPCWELVLDEEGRSAEAPHKRSTARIIARKP